MVSPIARIRKLLAAVFGAPAHAQTWDQAHGDSMNAGYVNVTTAPATGTPQKIRTAAHSRPARALLSPPMAMCLSETTAAGCSASMPRAPPCRSPCSWKPAKPSPARR